MARVQMNRRKLLQLAVIAPLAAIASQVPVPAQAAQAQWKVDIGVPERKQLTPASCARASATMVLNYFGFEVHIKEPRVITALPELAHITNHVVPSFSALSDGMLRGVYFDMGTAF